MKQEFAPRRVNIKAFTQQEETFASEERLAEFPRLVQETQGLGAETMVTYAVRGWEQKDAAGQLEPWIELQAQAVLALTCQRCLGPVDVPVAFERQFRFVATEELAAVEDEESEEDVLVISRTFDLLDLVEDELLMAMPVSAMHPVCPEPLKMQVIDADFDADEGQRPNPFAALAGMRKNPGDGEKGS